MKREKLKKKLGQMVFEKAARHIGARVILNGDWGFAGQIRYKNGVTRYFRRAHLDINPSGACEIAKYKCYASYFIAEMGYPVTEGMTFFADNFARELGSPRDIHAAYRYARSIGFPVMIKPNSKGQGEGVTKVYNRREFFRGMRKIFKIDTAGLVQRLVVGRDYRVVALDDEIVSAYERRPLEVLGDGKSTIGELLEAKQRAFKKNKRLFQLKLDDDRLARNLHRRKLTLQSVLGRGESVRLLDNANVSTGGEAHDVTQSVHPDFKKIAIDITRKMGLRLCGVDFMVQGDITERPGTYWVIEINDSPGLDSSAFSCSRRAKVVHAIYVKVLKAMA